MKFGGNLKDIAEKVADQRMRRTMLRYKQLKKDVKSIAFQLHDSGRCERLCEGDCAVCLEPLGRDLDVVTTSCGHRFHPICVAEALIAGRDHSCPLCRTPLELAIPGGVDGDILGFLARLRMAAHEMTTCHAQVLNEISSRFEQLASKSAAERRADSCIPVLARWKQQRAQQKQEHSIIQLRDKLDESALWALTNLQGLRKILKKFDKRTGMALRGEFLRQLVLKKSFVQDSLPGTGRCCQILHGVLELQRANTQPLAQPQMSVSMEQVFHDIERRYEQVFFPPKLTDVSKVDGCPKLTLYRDPRLST